MNCGAFTEEALEAELFGHERSAYPGAGAGAGAGEREGVLEMADSGTLFLDELGATSLSVQVKLLRLLEEGHFQRLGGREPVHVDVRIVAAAGLGPRGPGFRWAIPSGSLLQAQCVPHYVAPPTRPGGGHSPPDAPLPRRDGA